MEDFTPSFLHRWTFDLETGTVKEEPLDDVEHALPRIDDARVGLHYRYGWGTQTYPGMRGGIEEPRVLVRYDLARGTSRICDLGPTSHPDEFVFAPAPGRTAEDEGYLLGFVYDHASGSSDLVILDASAFPGEAVARIHLPRRVPHGFHGSWLPSGRF